MQAAYILTGSGLNWYKGNLIRGIVFFKFAKCVCYKYGARFYLRRKEISYILTSGKFTIFFPI